MRSYYFSGGNDCHQSDWMKCDADSLRGAKTKASRYFDTGTGSVLIVGFGDLCREEGDDPQNYYIDTQSVRVRGKWKDV